MNRRARCLLVFLYVSLVGAGCGTPLGARQLVRVTSSGTNQRTLITHVDVFTAQEGAATLRDQDVVLEGDRIVSITPAGDSSPEGVAVIDGRGRTLLPGFIDAHVHLGLMGDAPWARVKPDLHHALGAHLYAGVTTVFDVGGDVAVTRGLRDEVEAGGVPGPRIFLTEGPFTGPGSHPVPLGKELVGFPIALLIDLFVDQAANPAEAATLVEGRVAKGVDYVKITFDDMPPGTPHMREEVLRAALEATHRAGHKAIVHTTAAEDIVRAAELGADLIAHGPYRDVVTEEQAARLAATGVPVVLTFTGFDAMADAVEGRYAPHPMVRETTPDTLLSPVTGQGGLQMRDYPTLVELAAAAAAGRPRWATSVQRLVAAQVPLLVGTDSALPGAYAGG
ncbi:MAG: amidohydrolase family protein, partial [Myxococcota bacterium]